MEKKCERIKDGFICGDKILNKDFPTSIKTSILSDIYKDCKLTDMEIDKAIDYGASLYELYENQKLNDRTIDKAITKMDYLSMIYKHQKMSRTAIDKAIKTGINLEELKNQHLTQEQKQQIEESLKARQSGEETEKKMSVSFTVNSKDLFDKKKNPNLSLSPTDIMKNKKIPKKYL